MFDLSQINFATLIYDIIKTIIITGTTALITYLICKHYAKYIRFAKKMKTYGFDHSVVVDQINFKKIFTKADTIKMMYVSAYGFFNDNEKIALIESAAQRGVNIKFLFAKKGTCFINDIMNIERKNGNRTSDNDINDEVDYVNSKINEIIKKYPQSKIEVRYFSTEFRMPMVIANFKTINGIQSKGYLNITFLPALSKDHILLSGTASEYDYENEDHKNIVKLMKNHFDSVWEISSTNKD